MGSHDLRISNAHWGHEPGRPTLNLTLNLNRNLPSASRIRIKIKIKSGGRFMESFDLQLALGGSASLCLMQCFCAFCAFWRLSRTLERNWLAAKRRRMRKRVDSNWLAEWVGFGSERSLAPCYQVERFHRNTPSNCGEPPGAGAAKGVRFLT